MPQLDTLVGRRIVVRTRLRGQSGPTGGPAYTDTIGTLLSYDGTALRVQRRDGSEAALTAADVAAIKEVPAGSRRIRTRPAMDYFPEELAQICTHGWPPRITEPLGAWTLRASGGFTGRANSAAVHGEPGMPLPEALERVVAFYTSYGLPPKAQVIDDTPWASRFADAGWVGIGGTRDHALVQVADIRTVLESAPGSSSGPDEGACVDEQMSDAWLAAVERDTAAATSEDVWHVYASPPIVGFASISGPDGLESVSRIVVTGEWAGLSAVHTLPHARRRGHAARLLLACTRWASERGADKLYLQTMQHNTAALALYGAYGFVTHHTYRYLQPSAS